MSPNYSPNCQRACVFPSDTTVKQVLQVLREQVARQANKALKSQAQLPKTDLSEMTGLPEGCQTETSETRNLTQNTI